MFEMGTGGAASLEPPGSIQFESMHHFSQSHKGLSRRLQGYRFWPEGYDVCAGNRVQLSGTGGREVDQEFEQEKGDGISPTRSHRFPYCPILPGNSRYFLSEALHLDKMWTRIFNFGPIVSHSCFSWRLGGPCLRGCRLTPAVAQRCLHRDGALFIERMII